ncbi:hypothetical protein BN439_3538 [Erwinia amylovora Ea644]|nr:hypothetical protein BN439_3538 [Erwinia amylovora Ea644]
MRIITCGLNPQNDGNPVARRAREINFSPVIGVFALGSFLVLREVTVNARRMNHE